MFKENRLAYAKRVVKKAQAWNKALASANKGNTTNTTVPSGYKGSTAPTDYSTISKGDLMTKIESGDSGATEFYNKTYATRGIGTSLKTPKPEPTELEKTLGQTYDEQAGDVLSGEQLANYEYAKKMGIGNLPYKTTEGMIDYQNEGQQQQRDYLAQSQAYAKQSEGIAKKTSDIQTKAQEEAIKAQMAQGREGVMSAGAPMVVKGVQGAISRYKTQLGIERSSAELNRQKAEQDLERAIESDDIELASALRGQIKSISNQLRQLDIDEIDAEAKAQTTLNAKTENVRDTMEKMGSAIANLSFTELSSLVEGTNITPGQAVQLQKAYELEGQARETKNLAEAQELQQKAKQLKMEVDAGLFGTAEMKEGKWYMGLNDTQKQQYAEWKNQGYDFMNVDGVGIVKVPKNGGKASIAFSTGELPGFVPSDASIDDVDTTKPGSNGILSYDKIYKGSSANKEGVDFTAARGTPVSAQLTGQVVSVVSNCLPGDLSCNGGWGNQVKIKDSNNNIHTYNHLNTVNVTADQVTIGMGESIGTVGNTGKVMAGNGASLSREQIASGRGSHLDYTVLKPDGSKYSLDEAFKFANGSMVAGGADTQESALLKVPKEARTAVTTKANQFDGEQNVKSFQTTQEGYNFVQSIPSDTTNPADDIGFIYAFAKIMDPNSVVREGEYATVQKYAQSWADSFGFNAKRVFSNSKFLSEEALNNMKATLESKYNASKQSYDQVRNQYVKSINSLAGKNIGDEILQDYTTQKEEVDGVDLEDIWGSIDTETADDILSQF